MIKNISKKLLVATTVFGLAVVLVLPAGYVNAAAGDVLLTENLHVTLTTPASTFIIEGGVGIQVESIESSGTQIIINREDGDTAIVIRNADRYIMVVTGITDPGTECNVSQSRIVLPAPSTSETITIDPSTLCVALPSPPSGGGGGGASPTPTPDPTPTPSTQPTTTTGSVGATAADGGKTTLTTSDNTTATVDLPANAVSANTTVTVVADTPSNVTATRPVPSGKTLVGTNVYDYTATASGVAVTTFSADVTIEISYLDTDILGLNENSLKVYWWDTVTSTWMVLATTVDVVSNKVTATTDHFTYFVIMGDPEGAVDLVDTDGGALVDGDLVSTQESFDIYIASFVGTKRFKRLILNPSIFDSYGHLDWGNVKTVSQEVLDGFTLSDLVLEVNADGSTADEKVYKVSSAPDSDVGEKQWLNMTAVQFEAEGYDWDALAKINQTEAGEGFYPTGDPITSSL